MQKTALLFVALLSIALSATSQPYRWLPVTPQATKTGLVIDSTAIYNIAENKRQAIDCFQDAYVRDSIICAQEATIATQQRQNTELALINQEWRAQNDKLSNSLTLEKPKKYKWGAIGAGIGFVLALFL